MSDCCTSNGRAGYDLAVIGAGSAGFSAAIAAAEEGAHVALIGAGTIGGTCVNVGCVPSKTLIRAVETLHQAKAAGRFDGVAAEARLTDWRAMVAQKQALVDDLRQAKYIDLLPAYNQIAYREGAARCGEGGALLVCGAPRAADQRVRDAGGRPATAGARAAPEHAHLRKAASRSWKRRSGGVPRDSASETPRSTRLRCRCRRSQRARRSTRGRVRVRTRSRHASPRCACSRRPRTRSVGIDRPGRAKPAVGRPPVWPGGSCRPTSNPRRRARRSHPGVRLRP